MKKIIQLTYVKFIDQTAKSGFERIVFQQSFDEFVFKCQEYNPSNQFFSLSQIIENNPKANSLHYKTAMAIGNTMRALQSVIPDLKDTIGNQNIIFEKYEMKIIASNPFNKADHHIAIYFTTPDLYLHEIINNFIVVSNVKSENLQPAQTFSLDVSHNISITRYSEVELSN